MYYAAHNWVTQVQAQQQRRWWYAAQHSRSSHLFVPHKNKLSMSKQKDDHSRTDSTWLHHGECWYATLTKPNLHLSFSIHGNFWRWFPPVNQNKPQQWIAFNSCHCEPQWCQRDDRAAILSSWVSWLIDGRKIKQQQFWQSINLWSDLSSFSFKMSICTLGTYDVNFLVFP